MTQIASAPGVARLPGTSALATLNLFLALGGTLGAANGAGLGHPFEGDLPLLALQATLLAPIWIAIRFGVSVGLRGFDRAEPAPPAWREAARRGLLGGAVSGPAFGAGLAGWELAFGVVGTIVDPEAGTLSEMAREGPIWVAAVVLCSMIAIPPATLIGATAGTLLGVVDRALFFGFGPAR